MSHVTVSPIISIFGNLCFDAEINEYKIWLMSDKDDYIRRYGDGGFCEGNLNRYPFTPESESVISDDLISASKQRFPNIEIIGLTVTCDIKRRVWIIKIVVKDKITGIIGSGTDNGIVVSVD
jgi:hypothetical protein